MCIRDRLKAGQMSLHHPRVVHGSGINKSNDRRTLKILKKINLDRSITSILGYLSEVSNIAATSFSGSLPILLSKSNYSELPMLSENIYLLSTSSEAQARLSAQYAVNILGYKNIGVLSSADDENKNYANHFIEELNQLGVDPISVEWYYGKPENLSKQFTSIRKSAWSLLPNEDPDTEYLDLKIDSLDALFDVDVADFMDLVDDSQDIKMSKRDSLKISLNTIDAIYIPIDKKDLSYIGTQLPMYNLETKIIGNESWMDIDILSQDIIGPHLQGLTVLSSEYPKFGMAESSDLDRVFSMGYDHSYFINSLKRSKSTLPPLNKIKIFAFSIENRCFIAKARPTIPPGSTTRLNSLYAKRMASLISSSLTVVTSVINSWLIGNVNFPGVFAIKASHRVSWLISIETRLPLLSDNCVSLNNSGSTPITSLCSK